jgi:hypothetical protein
MPDIADLTERQLLDGIATMASHVYAGTCRWLELVGELDRRGGWEESGSGSVAEWLAWRCALLPRAAREHVRVARRLPDLPLTHEAFACGELSYAKVRALTRVAEPHSEERLLGLARVMTAAQLERALAALRRVTTAVARELHEKAELTTFWDDDGSLVIHGRLAPEDGALLLRALQHARDGLMERVLKEERGSAEPRPRPTNAEALVAVADTALASNPRHSGADRYQVVVHVDANVLEQDGEGGSALDDGPAVSPETARRICCDSSVVAISHRKRQNGARGTQDAGDPACASARARGARSRVPLPRLPEPPIRRCASHPALGPRWRDRARQPRPALRAPSHLRARRGLHDRRRRKLLQPVRPASSGGLASAARRCGRSTPLSCRSRHRPQDLRERR